MKAPGTFTGSVVTSAEMNGLGHVFTSSTRPVTEAYEGRRIYETDTSMWQSYDDSAWSPIGPVDGALTDWSGSIQVDQGVTNIGRSSTLATYSRVGRQVTGMFRVVFNAAGTAGGTILATLPVAAAATSNTTVIGSAAFLNSGGFLRSLVAVIGVTANRMQFTYGVYLGPADETIASGETLTCTFSYEAAS